MTTTLDEAAFIRAEHQKLNKKLKRQLQTVDQTGEIGRKANEMLSVNGLIAFGPPRPGVNPYNCFRLTDKGREALADLILDEIIFGN